MQITEFGGPEVLNVVDLPDPVPDDGHQLFDVSAAGADFAGTHHLLSWGVPRHGRQARLAVARGCGLGRVHVLGAVSVMVAPASSGGDDVTSGG